MTMTMFGKMGRAYGGNDNDELQSKQLPPMIAAKSGLGAGPTYVQSRVQQIARPPVETQSTETPARPPFGVMGQKELPKPPEKMSTWDRIWAPTYKVQQHDRAQRGYQERIAAQQQAEAAEAKRLQLAGSIGRLKGMTPEAADFFSRNPEKFFENYAENYGVNEFTAGNTYSMFGETHTADQNIETEQDAYGRTIFADPNSQTVSEPHGDVKPEILSDGAQLIDPLTGEMVAENEKDFTPHAGVQVNLPGGERQRSKLDDKRDERYAEELVEWEMGGGADAMKQMAQVSEVIKQLEDGADLTGPLLGMASPGFRVHFNQGSVNAQELVEEVVQRNLRIILGAQFTAKEGEQLIKRAYNPQLDESYNTPRLKRLLQQMHTAANQKQAAFDYYTENGTMAGFTGKTPAMADFYNAMNEGTDNRNNPDAGGEDDSDEAILKRLGLQ